jgi:hypothetical protein
MPIYTDGNADLSALIVPDAYTNVEAPPAAPATGQPSNILGIVGVASWGPVNSPVKLSPAQVAAAFGPVTNRAHDLATYASIAALLGVSVLDLVRVTDGTDVAAMATIQTSGGSFTAKYTGTLGNKLQVTIASGSATSSFKVTLAIPGVVPETFDNITGTGAQAWANIASAINNGQGNTRGPSNLAVFSAGASTTTPVVGSYTLSGGLDGATTITSSVLVGTDGAARTGMYALRGTGVAVGMLADCSAPTTWSVQNAFALSEVLQMVDANVAGDTPAAFATAMGTAGVDSPWFKAMLGDWIYWSDNVNNVVRLVSPQVWYAAWKVSNPPSQSALNKQLPGIVGTQKSQANQTYSTADLQTIAGARGDVICNPCPGGAYFGCRFGRNTSSDPGRRQDAYTTMTNFLATSIDAVAGPFVGQVGTPDEQREAQSTISGFLQTLASPEAGQPQIGAFSVTVTFNNATGVQVAVVQVQYLGIVEYFVIDLTGGQTVQVVTAAQAQQILA